MSGRRRGRSQERSGEAVRGYLLLESARVKKVHQVGDHLKILCAGESEIHGRACEGEEDDNVDDVARPVALSKPLLLVHRHRCDEEERESELRQRREGGRDEAESVNVKGCDAVAVSA